MATTAGFTPRTTSSIFLKPDFIDFSGTARRSRNEFRFGGLARTLLRFRPVINGPETDNVAAGSRRGARWHDPHSGVESISRQHVVIAQREPAIDRRPAAADGEADAARARNRAQARSPQGPQSRPDPVQSGRQT